MYGHSMYVADCAMLWTGSWAAGHSPGSALTLGGYMTLTKSFNLSGPLIGNWYTFIQVALKKLPSVVQLWKMPEYLLT